MQSLFMQARRHARRAVVCFAIVFALSSGSASALPPLGNLTWSGSGTNGNWSTGSNWFGGNSPLTTGTYSLSFGGSTRISGTNDIGTINVNALSFTNSGSISPSTDVFTISGTTLSLVGATITSAAATNGVAYNGDTIASILTLTGSNKVTLGSNHPLSISGSMSGAGSMTYDGAVSSVTYVYLSGSNSYSGDTFITGGNVQTGIRTGSGSNNFAFGSGLVTVSGSGQLLVRNNSTVTNNILISGTGGTGNAMIGSFGTGGTTATVSGTVTLAADATIGTASSVTSDTTSKFVITGPVNLGSNTLTLRPDRSTNVDRLNVIQIDGIVSGSGSLLVNAQLAASRVILNGSNSYTGSTTINSGTLVVGNSSALGNNAALIVNTTGLDLNGFSATAGALSGSSTGVILSSVAGAARLTTTSTSNSTYAGSILDGGGTVGLTKAGSGALSLTGSNNYSGSTIINGGVLGLDGANAIGGSGDVTFGGGTLRYSASNTTDLSSRVKNSGSAVSIDTNGQAVTFASGLANTNTGGLTKLGAGTLTLTASNAYTGTTTVSAGVLQLGSGGTTGSIAGNVSNNASLVFNRSNAVTYAGVVSGSGSLTKQGTGSLNLTGTSSYTGATNVDVSSLFVNGQLGNTAVTVASGALLGGNGTILGGVTVLAGGTLSPGNSPGILHVGSLQLNAASTTIMEVTGTASALFDQVVSASSVAYGGLLDIIISGSYANNTSFKLFDFASESGDFTSLGLSGSGPYASLQFGALGAGGYGADAWVTDWTTPGVPNGQRLVFYESTGTLVVVPEPSTYALLACGAGVIGLLHRRKRRQASPQA